MFSEELYERFKENLEGVNGECVRTSRNELGKTIADIYQKDGISSLCLGQSPLFEAAGVKAALESAGLTVHTDHVRKNAETDKGGVTENGYGIAELGSMMQMSDDVDGRIIATMSEHYIGVVKGSTIVPLYDDMFDILSEMPELPAYVGFITGPSRTADIECVGTVGVHGPIKLTAVIVDDA